MESVLQLRVSKAQHGSSSELLYDYLNSMLTFRCPALTEWFLGIMVLLRLCPRFSTLVQRGITCGKVSKMLTVFNDVSMLCRGKSLAILGQEVLARF